MSKYRLRLTLDVTYDNAAAPEVRAYLRRLLDSIPRRAAGEGLMSGDSEAEVDTWDARVEEVQ